MVPCVDEILIRLSADDPAIRERAADEVTDIHRGLDDRTISDLVRALMNALLSETGPDCMEAILNALCEVKSWHVLDPSLLSPLATLGSTHITTENQQLITELLGES
jgi:hypothetical protein